MTDLHLAVGNLITGKIAGTFLDELSQELIRHGTIGGVTLFKENVQDIDQLIDLIEQCHQLAPGPFLVAVDEEGGAVQRFHEVITPLPSAMAIGATANLTAALDLFALSARQLHWLGVNCNLAPVLDVNSNPLNPIIGTRSFGSDPAVVTELGQAIAQVYVDQAVLPVGKHFPGHGDTAEDSHLALAVAHADANTLYQRELIPFANLAKILPAMMVGHVWLPAFEENPVPATLSYKVTSELLRRELDFNGFVFTDDLPVMKAIMDNWGLEEASVMAIQAGADNLLISGTVEQLNSVHDALSKACRSGHINDRQLAKTLHRRANAMQICMSLDRKPLDQRRKLLKSSLADGKNLALDVSASCLCLIRGQLPDIAATADQWIVIAPSHMRYGLDLHAFLCKALGLGSEALLERRYSMNIDGQEIAALAEFGRDKKCLLLTYRALSQPNHLELADQLAAVVHRDSVLVACDVPYEISDISGFENALATFDPSALAMESLAKALVSRASLPGRCPVDMRLISASPDQL